MIAHCLASKQSSPMKEMRSPGRGSWSVEIVTGARIRDKAGIAMPKVLCCHIETRL